MTEEDAVALFTDAKIMAAQLMPTISDAMDTYPSPSTALTYAGTLLSVLGCSIASMVACHTKTPASYDFFLERLKALLDDIAPGMKPGPEFMSLYEELKATRS